MPLNFTSDRRACECYHAALTILHYGSRASHVTSIALRANGRVSTSALESDKRMVNGSDNTSAYNSGKYVSISEANIRYKLAQSYINLRDYRYTSHYIVTRCFLLLNKQGRFVYILPLYRRPSDSYTMILNETHATTITTTFLIKDLLYQSLNPFLLGLAVSQ